MELEFWKPTASTSTVKLTVHKNGNMGFSSGAVDKMQINEKKYVKIGTNRADKRDNNLYLVLTAEKDDNALKVNKAGNYFYLNTTVFFNELNIEYKKKKLIYDIVELEVEDKIIYKLIRREIDRKKK
jgi:hypothetical protein